MGNLNYSNPIIEQRADPWVYKHTDGFYYFTASVPEYDRIELRRSDTIQGLGAAEPVAVWRKHDSGPMSANVWAPEIHYIGGKWYIYFAAGRADSIFDIHMYVLENDCANPLEGEWTERGQIKTDWESFSLDATTFEHRGIRYLVWAQNDPNIPGNTNLYMAKLVNPWTIESPQIMISKPEHPWECIGFLVNEGAAFLAHGDRVFLSYSGSATNHHYCMGLLTAAADADLLDPASWSKSGQPVFASSVQNSQFGPGHNSFTMSEDGRDVVMVYHARNYQSIEGDPLFDPNRHTRAQRIAWHEDGTPDFGVPVPDAGIRS